MFQLQAGERRQMASDGIHLGVLEGSYGQDSSGEENGYQNICELNCTGLTVCLQPGQGTAIAVIEPI